MLEQKVAQIVPKVAQILLRSYVFKIAQKVTKYLVRFWEKIYYQELFKNAQSGHTHLDLHSRFLK